MSKKDEGAVLTERARPVTVHEAKELQHYGTVARLPIALDASVCAASAGNLNQLLADTMTLRDLYKKHHWSHATRGRCERSSRSPSRLEDGGDGLDPLRARHRVSRRKRG